MNPSRLFILRPVATSLLMAALLLAGVIAYRQLPVSALPQVDYPTIQVLTFYPGASPEVMASSVTAPLERQFGQMPGLNQMMSTSSSGSSLITLQFALDLSLDVAEQEVQAAINAATTYLPRDLPNPPIYSKTNPADAPVLTLALTSSTLPLSKVQDLADTRLAQKISQLPGVGLVSISGGQKPAVRVQANPTALGRLRAQPRGSAHRHRAGERESGEGQLRRRASSLHHRRQRSAAVERRLPPAGGRLSQRRAGARLRRRRRRSTTRRTCKQAAWMNTVPAVILNIQRQPGANIISVVDRIEKLLPQLTASLPPSVQVAVLTDRTITIRASVQDVQFELMLTVALVVMVLFLFLRSLSATIIPSVAVPLSLVGTFGVMYLLGYSLDNLSLMALTISTGFVVDDAIVMIENITRYIEAGEPPLQAALKGSQADRLHHRVADRLAHRRADSAAVHGRHRRAPVPRVRRHLERHDSGVGGRVADADADDVRQAVAPHARGGAGALLSRLGALLQHDDRALRDELALGAAAPDRDAVGRDRHARRRPSSCTSSCRRASSRCRTPA